MEEAYRSENRVDYVLHGRAYGRAVEVYNKKIKDREPEDFIGGEFYTEEAVGGIVKKVDAYEKLFREELETLDETSRSKVEMSKKLSDCLEGIILNTKSWFGVTSQVYPTTKWDDYANGVDLVVERMSGDIVNHQGFALDVTYGGYNTISKKIRRISERLKRGNLGKIDFFKSNDGRFKGQLGEIPLVVIGADGNTMKDLVNLFAEKEDQKIEDHPVQFQIIEQVIMQCDFFIDLAKQMEDKNSSKRIIEAYEKLRKDFELIKKTKQMLHIDGGANFRDIFYKNLADILESLKAPKETSENSTAN